MNGRCWMAVGLLAAVALGCSDKSPHPSSTSTGSSGPHFVERPTENPPLVVSETLPPDAVISPAPPVALPTSPYVPTTDPPAFVGPIGSGGPPEFAPANPNPPIGPLPGPGDMAFNPLRAEFVPPELPTEVPEPPPPAPLGENPLRMFRAHQGLRTPSAVPEAIATDTAPPDAAIPPGVPFAPESTPAATPEEIEAAQMAAAAEEELLRKRRELQALAAEAAAKSAAALPGARPIKVQALAQGADTSAGSATPPPTAPYDVVQVFYGTDRQVIDPHPETIFTGLARFVPAGVCILITVVLALVATASRRRPIWILAGCGVLASVGLAALGVSGTLYAIRHANHEGLRYTTERAPGGEVQVGVCDVTIPRAHDLGELEAPSIWRLEVKENLAEHVTVRKIERLADEPFYQQLSARVAASPQKELFVFVHGFNVSFEDAARRTAQIHHDLHFSGAPIFFSWPAHNKSILTYTADENNVSWTVDHLKKFLLDVTHKSGAKSVNLIAHSMGNRALTAALKELQLEFREESRLFNQVILAAPDIDADEFKTRIAPAMTRTANRITLYVSGRDEALMTSQFLHRGPRAGDALSGLVVLKGIDTIDVTPIDTSPWGHTYYGASDPVLGDLRVVLMHSAAPTDRKWLEQREHEGLPYWIFQKPTGSTARMPSGEPR